MGLTDVVLDPWCDFGKGWELKKSYLSMSAPWYKPIAGFPKVWTGGTNGLKRATVVLINAKDSAEIVNNYKGKLSGKILIMNTPVHYVPNDLPDLVRWTPAQLDSMQNIKSKAPDTAGVHQCLGEIKGTDKKLKDEVVMLGGHLDSWQGATGATDNAAGCAVIMEAVRILQKSGIKPRRTIRIALWSGEEQGLYGSREYVKKTFADRADMKLKPAR
ncbi:MAG: M20/M25/M40 family metallo-hydrolase [Sphingobacteriales bacterium]|nr:M20/M25/M40 family metallo-hydrolase [Sphingobacteriales bacterium]